MGPLGGGGIWYPDDSDEDVSPVILREAHTLWGMSESWYTFIYNIIILHLKNGGKDLFQVLTLKKGVRVLGVYKEKDRF